MTEYHDDAKYRPKRYQSIGKLFRRRIPIVSWLPKYDADQAVSDLIAGVTVGLTVMPQGLAYATLAGLEPQVRQIYTRIIEIIQLCYSVKLECIFFNFMYQTSILQPIFLCAYTLYVRTNPTIITRIALIIQINHSSSKPCYHFCVCIFINLPCSDIILKLTVLNKNKNSNFYGVSNLQNLNTYLSWY